MRANVKPLTHWAIYKGYKMRVTERAENAVSGIFTTETRQMRFRYDAIGMVVHLEENLEKNLEKNLVTINEYGWEVDK